MNPFDRLVTWLWDHTGERRAALRARVERGDRQLREFDESSERSIAQIRRTQEIGHELAERRR